MWSVFKSVQAFAEGIESQMDAAVGLATKKPVLTSDHGDYPNSESFVANETGEVIMLTSANDNEAQLYVSKEKINKSSKIVNSTQVVDQIFLETSGKKSELESSSTGLWSALMTPEKVRRDVDDANSTISITNHEELASESAFKLEERNDVTSTVETRNIEPNGVLEPHITVDTRINVVETEDSLKLMEILTQREKQLESMASHCSSLSDELESSRILLDKERQAHIDTKQQLDQLSISISSNKRLVSTQTELSNLRKEFDQLQKEDVALRKIADRVSGLESLVAEKEKHVLECQQEGSELQSRQLNLEKTIRQVRDQLRDKESQLTSHDSDMSKLGFNLQAKEEQLIAINSQLDNKEKETSHLQSQCATLTQQLVSRDRQMQLSNESRMETDRKTEDIALENNQLRKLLTDTNSELSSCQSMCEAAVNKTLKLEKESSGSTARENLLLATNQQLQESVQRILSESHQREEALKRDLLDMRKRWQDSINRSESLSNEIASSSTPLIKQITSLQQQVLRKEEDWRKTESDLRRTVGNCQSEIERYKLAEDENLKKDAKNNEMLHQAVLDLRRSQQNTVELQSEVTNLRSQVSGLTNNVTQLTSSSAFNETRYLELERSSQFEIQQLTSKLTSSEVEANQLRRETQLIQQQADLYRRYHGSSNHDSASVSDTKLSKAEIDLIVSSKEALAREVSRMADERYNLENEIYSALFDSLSGSKEVDLPHVIGDTVSIVKCIKASASRLTSRIVKLETERSELLEVVGQKVCEVDGLFQDLQDVKHLYRQELDRLMIAIAGDEKK